MGVAIEGVGLADVDDGVGYWGLAVTVGATGDVGLAADVGVAGTAAVAQLDIRTSAITTPIPVTNAGGRRIRTLHGGEKYLAVDIGNSGRTGHSYPHESPHLSCQRRDHVAGAAVPNGTAQVNLDQSSL